MSRYSWEKMSSGKWVTGQKGQGEDVGEGPLSYAGSMP